MDSESILRLITRELNEKTNKISERKDVKRKLQLFVLFFDISCILIFESDVSTLNVK